MPTYLYPLEKGGPKLIEISWKGMLCRNVSVSYEDQQLGVIEARADVKQGRHFRLPNGSDLFVRMVNTITATELYVTVDGRALPDSGGDPERQVKYATSVLYFYGAVGAIFGGTLLQGGYSMNGYMIIGAGALVAFLGWLVSRHSQAALLIAIALVLLNALMMIVIPLSKGKLKLEGAGWGWLAFYAFMLFPLVKAVPAIREINRDEDEKPFDQV
jgi:hypothetical protein